MGLQIIYPETTETFKILPLLRFCSTVQFNHVLFSEIPLKFNFNSLMLNIVVFTWNLRGISLISRGIYVVFLLCRCSGLYTVSVMSTLSMHGDILMSR